MYESTYGHKFEACLQLCRCKYVLHEQQAGFPRKAFGSCQCDHSYVMLKNPFSGFETPSYQLGRPSIQHL